MAAPQMKVVWRLLAVIPFVLVLGIVGIKLTAGDPSAPINKVPGVQSIYELGNDAPSTNVKVTPTKAPTSSITGLPTDLTAALTDGITFAPGFTMPTQDIDTGDPAPAATSSAMPTRTASTPAPTHATTHATTSASPQPTRSSSSSSPTPTKACDPLQHLLGIC